MCRTVIRRIGQPEADIIDKTTVELQNAFSKIAAKEGVKVYLSMRKRNAPLPKDALEYLICHRDMTIMEYATQLVLNSKQAQGMA